jgi:hypothetical protein
LEDRPIERGRRIFLITIEGGRMSRGRRSFFDDLDAFLVACRPELPEGKRCAPATEGADDHQSKRICPAVAAENDECSTTNRSALLSRLLAALPKEEDRLKEPCPSRIFDPHRVPPVPTDCLRIVQWNLLDDIRVSLGMGGIHAVWDIRRIGVLRTLLALDADAILLEELSSNADRERLRQPTARHGKAVEFLRATLGGTHTLVTSDSGQLEGPLGVLFRHAPHPTRGVWLERAGRVSRRVYYADGSLKKKPIGSTLHVPLDVHGLCSGELGRRIILSPTHLHAMVSRDSGAGLLPSDAHADAFAASLGRDMLRLPHRAAPTEALMVVGGDFNDGKRKLYAELTARTRWAAADSADEWSEDERAGEPPWPPEGGRAAPIAIDLWRQSEAREYGGLQAGSTALSALQQNFHGLQGVESRRELRRRNGEPWPEHATDVGHIDWLLLASAAGGSKARARSVGIGTETVIPPLPPLQPSLLPKALPAGGSVFASDHYPLWVDLALDEPTAPPRPRTGGGTDMGSASIPFSLPTYE